MTGTSDVPPPAASRQPDITLSFSKTVVEDPAILHARLRRECPVALQESDGGPLQNGWLVTRYDDIVAVARDTETFAQSVRWPGQRRPPLESDPPEHRRFRALMQPFFMPAALAPFEPLSRSIAASLLKPLIAAGGGDIAHAVARPLPPQLLLARLGQPLADWKNIKQWCEDSFLQGSQDPADLDIYKRANESLWAYSHALVEDRKARPRAAREDMVSAMLQARIDDAPVDEDLVAGMVRLVLAAGHDSTTSAIGICLRFLADNPQAQSRLRANSAEIPNAIEEILRLQAPVLQMPRRVTRDVELGGRPLKQGDRVLLVFASGNRDEGAFTDPQACDFSRFPNRHLSFGTGVHVCIGNSLARQEIKVVLEELLAATQDFGLAAMPEREFWHPYGSTRLEVWLRPKQPGAG